MPEGTECSSPSGEAERFDVDLDVKEVTATWGKEVFRPAPYYSIEVGPFSFTAAVRPGESADEVFEKLMLALEAKAKAQFAGKLARFKVRAEKAML